MLWSEQIFSHELLVVPKAVKPRRVLEFFVCSLSEEGSKPISVYGSGGVVSGGFR